MPTPARYRLKWNPSAVSKLMAKNKIGTRHELAKRLPIGRATVYEAFAADWSGYATDRMLALLEAHLSADIGPLVTAHQTARKPGRTVRKP
jgi:hypothetical protein